MPHHFRADGYATEVHPVFDVATSLDVELPKLAFDFTKAAISSASDFKGVLVNIAKHGTSQFAEALRGVARRLGVKAEDIEEDTIERVLKTGSEIDARIKAGLENLKELTNAEKGELGELAPDRILTERLGYKRLPSKLKGNQGIDGIFVKYKPGTEEPEDILLVESKFSSSGRYRLGETLDGQQMSTKWIEAKVDAMLRSTDDEVRSAGRLIDDYTESGIVRTKLNLLTPDGINRWNTFDTYIYKPGGI